MPSMGFRSNRPARLDSRTNSNNNDDHDDMSLRSPNRQSIHQLTHQQLVTRQRQLLLRQKSDHFADGKDIAHSLTRTTSSPYMHKTLDPKASTSSVNTIVNSIESKIERVDVGRAIELLQELKKSATADELVALHRALLPVKEDKPTQAPQLPPIEELAYTSVPTDRTRSSIPPGLATRNGSYTDPLRKPSEPALAKSSSVDRKDSWFPDVDRRTSRTASPERLSTPPEQTSYQGGAYQTGTLRITNGAASPEPGVISKWAMEIEQRDEKPGVEVSPLKKVPSPLRKRMTMAILSPLKSQDEANSSARRKRTAMAANPEGNNQLEAAPAPILPKLHFARSKDDLGTTSLRASMIGLNTNPTPGPLLPTLASLDFTKDLEAPQVVEPRAQSFDFGAGERSSIRKELQLDPPLQRHSFQHITTESTEDVSRFQQRWGHRASHLSNDYTSDGGITQSPYEEKRGLLDFATRLSTVCDEDEGEAEGVRGDRDSHADTLNKLTGGIDQPEVGVATSSDEAGLSSDSPCARRGKVIRKADSGYCSDVSAATLPHISTCQRGTEVVIAPTGTELSQEPRLPSIEPAVTNTKESGIQVQDNVPLADTNNLPTFAEMSGPQSDANMSSSSKEGPKKSPLALFRPKAARSKSFTVLNVQKGAVSVEDVSRSSTFQSSDDAPPPLNHKKSKKLQKSMPESVRHQRKKTMDSIKASQVVQTETSDASNEQSSDPDGFIGCQPNDVRPQEGDDGTSLFSRKRGKSFGRKRSKTVTDTTEEVSPPPSGANTPVSSSHRHRRRSKSIASIPAISAPVSRQPSEDVTSAERQEANELPTLRRDLPLSTHSNFASVAQALTSHPPDTFTETARSAAAARRQHKRYYSMHRASSDGASLTGGSSVPGLPVSPNADQPSSAKETTEPETPRKQIESSIVAGPVAVGSNTSVEDRFPGWEGKPATNIASESPTYLQPPHTPRLRNNSVPALPELPADIAAKVAKADEMVAKKLKNSPRSSPIGSTRSSIDHHDGKKFFNPAKKQASPKDQARQAALDKLTASYDRKFDEQKADLSVKELTLKKPSDQGARRSIDGSIKLRHPQKQPVPTSPTHDSRHPGWPGWEKQSSLWRERREAMAEPVTFEESMSAHAQTVPTFEADSPSIVVSRYITPLTAENVKTASNAANGGDSPTESYAQEYSDLIVSDLEDSPAKPDMYRPDSAFSGNMTSATFVTVQPAYDDRPVRADIPRSDTTLSSSCTTTTTTVCSTTSWAGSTNSSTTASSVSSQFRHGRTKSGHFKAFRPTDAAQAERSRALSVARRSAYHASTESLGHSRNESLDLPALPRSKTDLTSLKNRSSESVLDRYSGGHGHGAFGGSAGTRSSKELRDGKCTMGGQFGLDLSDVPMFLSKV